MTGKCSAVFEIYPHRAAVEYAVTVLKNSGFRNTDVSVLLPDELGTDDFVTEKATKAPEGAAAGAGSGAVIGGTLGLLAGTGALVIPGLGPFIVAGPIVATLAGIGVGGAIGGFAGVLVGLGIPEYEARKYESRVGKGGVLLSVHCDNSDWIQKAKDILIATGGEDISSTKEAAGFTEPHPSMSRTRK
jgi:hypothetical protein